MGCHALLQGIFSTQGLNPHLLHLLNWQVGSFVPDVEQFPGHIACSSLSRSEIVVPVFAPSGEVSAVLDIDSEHLATFDVTDKEWLEKIVATLYE